MKQIFSVVILLILSYSCIEPTKNDNKGYVMYTNDLECNKKHPSIHVIYDLKDSKEYLYTYAEENNVKTINFSTYILSPGVEVRVLNDSLEDARLYEIEFQRKRIHGKDRMVKGFIWKGFLVSSKDSISDCWKSYKPKSIMK